MLSTYQGPGLLKLWDPDLLVEGTQIVGFMRIPSFFELLMSSGDVVLAGVEETPVTMLDKC